MDIKGKLYSLFVGINQYQNPAVRDLKYAAADVEGLKDFLMDRMGLTEDNLISLVCPATNLHKVPLRGRLLKSIDNFTKKAMAPEDTFIFYFAGHGYSKNEIHYLLTPDSDPGSEALLEDTAISIPILMKYLKNIKAGHQLLILDACRNEPMNLGRGIGSGPTDTVSIVRDITTIARDEKKKYFKRFAVLNACREGQVSLEYPEGQHSWFCYNLLETLKAHKDPVVDILSLNEKITRRMQQLAWKELPEAESQLPDISITGGRFLLYISNVPEKETEGVVKKVVKKNEKTPNEIDDLNVDNDPDNPVTGVPKEETLKRIEDKLSLAVKDMLWEIVPHSAEKIIRKEIEEMKKGKNETESLDRKKTDE